MDKMSKTADEEMQKLWEQATPEQKYIIVRFMRNIVKPEKTPGADHRFGRFLFLSIRTQTSASTKLRIAAAEMTTKMTIRKHTIPGRFDRGEFSPEATADDDIEPECEPV